MGGDEHHTARQLDAHRHQSQRRRHVSVLRVLRLLYETAPRHPDTQQQMQAWILKRSRQTRTNAHSLDLELDTAFAITGAVRLGAAATEWRSYHMELLRRLWGAHLARCGRA